MKLIIAGSRNAPRKAAAEGILAALREWGMEGWELPTEVVCGCAQGADEHGKEWAEVHGIPVTEFPADWKAHGRAAGPIRNAQMAEYADALVAIWDGVSSGTRNMILEAQRRRLRVYVYNYAEDEG